MLKGLWFRISRHGLGGTARLANKYIFVATVEGLSGGRLLVIMKLFVIAETIIFFFIVVSDLLYTNH